MAIMYETNEEKAKREYAQKWLEAEIEFMLLEHKYRIIQSKSELPIEKKG